MPRKDHLSAFLENAEPVALGRVPQNISAGKASRVGLDPATRSAYPDSSLGPAVANMLAAGTYDPENRQEARTGCVATGPRAPQRDRRPTRRRVARSAATEEAENQL